MAREKDEIGGDIEGKETSLQVKPETTPEEKPELAEKEETLTLSSKELQDRINAAKAELGRTLKTTLESHSVLQRNYDAQVKRHSALEEAVRSLKQKERERELKSAEGTPDLIDSVRLKHQAEDEWEKVNKARSEHETEVSRWQAKLDRSLKIEAEEKARELAKESGLTADLLLQIGSDTAENGRVTYNLKRMEAIAKSVPKGEGEEEAEEAEVEGGEPAVRGQRSRAAGAGIRSATRGFRTWEDYEEAFIHGEISFEQYQEAAKRFNKNL